jgi:hypothetical protein
MQTFAAKYVQKYVFIVSITSPLLLKQDLTSMEKVGKNLALSVNEKSLLAKSATILALTRKH